MRVSSQHYLYQIQNDGKGRTLQQMALERQIQTNTRAKDLADIGSKKMDSYVTAQTIKEKINGYIYNIDTASTRLDEYKIAFDSMRDITNTMKNLLKDSEGLENAKLLGLPDLAENYLKMVEGVLNTKEDMDTYLFHGKDGRIGSANVDLEGEKIADETSEKILDEVEGAVAAYSLRQLDKDYTGSAIRLRRSSDNAEMDFGFDENGDLDIDAITAWQEEGRSLNFDGNGGYINAGRNANINDIFMNGGKVEATIVPRSDGQASHGRIFYKGNMTLLVKNETAGKMRLSLEIPCSGGTGMGVWTTVDPELEVGEEAHIEIEYDKSSLSNDPIFKIDGVVVPIVEMYTPVGGIFSDSGHNLYIGNTSGNSRNFDGVMKDIQFYDTSTGSDVLKAHWKLDEKEGNIAYDTLGISDGIIDGGATWDKSDLHITTWYDQSGNGNDGSQSDISRQPELLTTGLNGKVAINLDGNNDFLSIADIPEYDFSDGFTLTATTENDGTGSLGGLRRFVSKGYGSEFILAASRGYMNDGAWLPAGHGLLRTDVRVSTSVFDYDPAGIDNFKFYSQNVEEGSNSTSNHMTNSNGDIYIGKLFWGESYFGGDFSEMIIYADALDSSDLTKVNTDAMEYWGVETPANFGANNNSEKVLDRMEDLDAGNARTAYSLRRVDKNYNGAAIKLRNSITNEEKDIYFNADGNLDTDAITALLGGADGYVTTWYDQSGNSTNAVQSVTAYQPRLELNGMNGNASLDFDGGDILMIDHAGELVSSNDITLSSFVSYDTVSAANNGTIYTQNDINNGFTTHEFSINDSSKLTYDNYNPAGGERVDSRVLESGKGHNLSFVRNSTNIGFIEDANYGEIKPEGGENRDSAAAIDNNLIGGRFYGGAVRDGFDGDMSELIIYDKAIKNDQQKMLNADSVKHWNNLEFQDYKEGVAIPNIVQDDFYLSDKNENLTTYNHLFENGSHGETYDTYKSYEVMISDTQKIDVNYSPYEAAIQNLVYGLNIVTQIIDADPSNVDPTHVGTPYSQMSDAAIEFFEAAETQFDDIDAQINIKQISLNNRKKHHVNDIEFYDALLHKIDGVDNKEELIIQSQRLNTTTQMSYAITASLSRLNLSRILF